jgi:hypothetical protein
MMRCSGSRTACSARQSWWQWTGSHREAQLPWTRCAPLHRLVNVGHCQQLPAAGLAVWCTRQVTAPQHTASCIMGCSSGACMPVASTNMATDAAFSCHYGMYCTATA